MSRSFLGIRQLSYKGALYPLETQLCKPSPQPSRIVPLFLDWSTYGASSAQANTMVNVNLPQPVQDRLGKIGSFYIDNTGSISPVYVDFPDTGFTITAAPGTAVWYPVFTNTFTFNVILENAITGFIPTTKIFISNQQIGPSTDPEINQSVALWRGSTQTQTGANFNQTTGFNPPALGDQIQTGTLNLGINDQSQLPLISGFPVGTFAYITLFTFFVDNITGNGQLRMVGSVSGGVLDLPYTPNCNGKFICQLNHQNWRISANEGWTLINFVPSITGSAIFTMFSSVWAG